MPHFRWATPSFRRGARGQSTIRPLYCRRARSPFNRGRYLNHPKLGLIRSLLSTMIQPQRSHPTYCRTEKHMEPFRISTWELLQSGLPVRSHLAESQKDPLGNLPFSQPMVCFLSPTRLKQQRFKMLLKQENNLPPSLPQITVPIIRLLLKSKRALVSSIRYFVNQGFSLHH